MGSSDTLGVVCALCCFVFPPFILQSVGLFTPNWVKTSDCDSIGLVYSCCSGDNNDTCKNTNGGDELDARVLGLEATAFAVMFLAIFGTSYESCCSGDDEDTGWCGLIGGCCLIMFPVAGLFSFIGCMIIAGSYSTSELGWSFYLCLTSGCLIIILTVCLCYCFCKVLKNDDDDDGPRQQSSGGMVPYEGSGGVAPYAGGQSGVAVAQVEQRAVVHDPESGGFLVVMRKFTIAHIVHNLQEN
ncbi:uncharacterized protein LOC132717509 isoform X1 [Ruditapes philippinarum]|uniref:uncharacterized protein LOC132717509 isoform X1 n=1 Tax=Ruditapes philippinarum TaxID=129788 RepID=UPI00295B2659|nr:uncharacterized protein LOC132717509 isoform X1 [Ruditapes philippinarum]XP_060556977.1 uncharacterized protein LOC132717509 isoform X1 [Ruditapes philippinarum]